MNSLQDKHRWLRAPKMVLIFCVIAIFGGIGGTAQARSLQEIRQTGEIRFCIADNHPSVAVAGPKGCREDCTFSGPVYEEVLAFTATLGDAVKPVFIRVDWVEQFYNQVSSPARK